MLTKVCGTCRKELPVSEFYKANKHPSGYQNRCKNCARELYREWAERTGYRLRRNALVQEWGRQNPERRAKHRLTTQLKKYGLTVQQYEELLRAQDGKCAVCRREPRGKHRLHVDHDHQFTYTIVVRGLLCANCNTALGLLEDSPELIQMLLRYIENYNEVMAFSGDFPGYTLEDAIAAHRS